MMSGTSSSYQRGISYSIRLILALGALFLLTHCAAQTQIQKVDEKEVLTKRVQKYWQLQIDGLFDQSYQFEVPAYRERFKIGDYMAKFKIARYTDAKVLDVKVDGEQGMVKLSVAYKLAIQKLAKIDNVRGVDENWVKVDDIWYHVPEGFELTKK
jgi:hypothetical protein